MDSVLFRKSEARGGNIERGRHPMVGQLDQPRAYRRSGDADNARASTAD